MSNLELEYVSVGKNCFCCALSYGVFKKYVCSKFPIFNTILPPLFALVHFRGNLSDILLFIQVFNLKPLPRGYTIDFKVSGNPCDNENLTSIVSKKRFYNFFFISLYKQRLKTIKLIYESQFRHFIKWGKIWITFGTFYDQR